MIQLKINQIIRSGTLILVACMGLNACNSRVGQIYQITDKKKTTNNAHLLSIAIRCYYFHSIWS